jgi:hypothetical protein
MHVLSFSKLEATFPAYSTETVAKRDCGFKLLAKISPGTEETNK